MNELYEQNQRRWSELRTRQKSEKDELLLRQRQERDELDDKHKQERIAEQAGHTAAYRAAKGPSPRLVKLVARARREWNVDAETPEAILERLKERKENHHRHSRPGQYDEIGQLKLYNQVSVLIGEIEVEMQKQGGSHGS